MPDYRITLRGKHLYSASLYANYVNATAAKLKYVVQHFMLFPMMYSKLGHKLVNVKTARINKQGANCFCSQNYIGQTTIFTRRLRTICLSSSSQTRIYYALFHALSNDIQQIGAQAHQRQNGKD